MLRLPTPHPYVFGPSIYVFPITREADTTGLHEGLDLSCPNRLERDFFRWLPRKNSTVLLFTKFCQELSSVELHAYQHRSGRTNHNKIITTRPRAGKINMTKDKGDIIILSKICAYCIEVTHYILLRQFGLGNESSLVNLGTIRKSKCFWITCLSMWFAWPKSPCCGIELGDSRLGIVPEK